MKTINRLILACLLSLLAGCVVEAPDSAETTAEARLPLSAAATVVYTISNQNAPATGAACDDPAASVWCPCGADFTDNSPRCNTPGETVMARIPPLGCEVASATLSYEASLWDGASTVAIHRLLRPVTDPPPGVAGLCASHGMASWFRSGPEAWSVPGALGTGTDRSAASAGRLLASGGIRTESFDVTAVLQGCSGGCVLAQYAAGPHVSVLGGTMRVVYECAGAVAVCGDGVVEGGEGCDDDNLTPGDGCSATCVTEIGWSCAGTPSACTTVCGDGVTAGAEQCDDGNTTSHDGCSATCTAEVCTCQ